MKGAFKLYQPVICVDWNVVELHYQRSLQSKTRRTIDKECLRWTPLLSNVPFFIDNDAIPDISPAVDKRLKPEKGDEAVKTPEPDSGKHPISVVAALQSDVCEEFRGVKKRGKRYSSIKSPKSPKKPVIEQQVIITDPLPVVESKMDKPSANALEATSSGRKRVRPNKFNETTYDTGGEKQVPPEAANLSVEQNYGKRRRSENIENTASEPKRTRLTSEHCDTPAAEPINSTIASRRFKDQHKESSKDEVPSPTFDDKRKRRVSERRISHQPELTSKAIDVCMNDQNMTTDDEVPIRDMQKDRQKHSLSRTPEMPQKIKRRAVQRFGSRNSSRIAATSTCASSADSDGQTVTSPVVKKQMVLSNALRVKSFSQDTKEDNQCDTDSQHESITPTKPRLEFEKTKSVSPKDRKIRSAKSRNLSSSSELSSGEADDEMEDEVVTKNTPLTSSARDLVPRDIQLENETNDDNSKGPENNPKDIETVDEQQQPFQESSEPAQEPIATCSEDPGTETDNSAIEEAQDLATDNTTKNGEHLAQMKPKEPDDELSPVIQETIAESVDVCEPDEIGEKDGESMEETIPSEMCFPQTQEQATFIVGSTASPEVMANPTRTDEVFSNVGSSNDSVNNNEKEPKVATEMTQVVEKSSISSPEKKSLSQTISSCTDLKTEDVVVEHQSTVDSHSSTSCNNDSSAKEFLHMEKNEEKPDLPSELSEKISVITESKPGSGNGLVTEKIEDDNKQTEEPPSTEGAEVTQKKNIDVSESHAKEPQQQPSSTGGYITNPAAGFINNATQIPVQMGVMNMQSQYQDPSAIQRAQQNSMYPAYSPYLPAMRR